MPSNELATLDGGLFPIPLTYYKNHHYPIHYIPLVSPTMSFPRHLFSPSTPQAVSSPNTSNVEAMFSQIMEVVLKSVSPTSP
jgi:hypothetical protein